MSDTSVLFRLKEMILTGALAPGERVTEAALAEKLGISRTPIRNALPALAADGMLEPVGRRGYAVRQLRPEESLLALEMRAALEGLAARTVAERGASVELLEALDDCLAEGDRIFEGRQLDLAGEEAYATMNARFHDLIIEEVASPLLHGFTQRLAVVPFVSPAVIVFDAGPRRSFDRLFRAHGDHHAIVEAIRQRDGRRAEAIFLEHARKQRESMFAGFDIE